MILVHDEDVINKGVEVKPEKKEAEKKKPAPKKTTKESGKK